jgi:hypothetical protein
MDIKIVKNSSTELIITQQKKLTITGSVFCLPAAMLLFILPLIPGLTLFLSCVILWMIVLLCFYKGVTYTFKASKVEKALELSVKGIFRTRKSSLTYQQIYHIFMAESDRFLQKTANCNYKIVIETSDKKYLKLFGFRNRQACKQTRALIESYL